MSKTWYPQINYENCIECAICTDMCTHEVYDKDEAPKPVVIFGEGCVQGCKDCGDACPSDAITYFGDDGKEKDSGCGCGSDCDGDCDCHSDGNADSSCGDDCACHTKEKVETVSDGACYVPSEKAESEACCVPSDKSSCC